MEKKFGTLQEFTTRKGIRVEIINSEVEGYSLRWTDEVGYYETHCYDFGETVPTRYKFPTNKHKKRFKCVDNEQYIFDLYKIIKRKRLLCKLDFSNISSIVYKFMKEKYGDKGIYYYGTQYVD